MSRGLQAMACHMPIRLEGRARTLSGPSPELTAARTFSPCPDADRPASSACTTSLGSLSRAPRLPAEDLRHLGQLSVTGREYPRGLTQLGTRWARAQNPPVTWTLSPAASLDGRCPDAVSSGKPEEQQHTDDERDGGTDKSQDEQRSS
jgi:hypothetical protein